MGRNSIDVAEEDDQGIISADGFSSTYGEQIVERERPGTSCSPPNRTKTIDSAQTLVHSAKPRESFLHSYQTSSPLYMNAGIAELVPIQKSPSQSTKQSSVSESQRSGEYGQPPRSYTKRPSDASVEGRLRQMSFGTITSDDLLWGQSTEHSVFQPLEIPEQREKHECPEELKAAFLQSFDAIGNEILDESWIRVATWWLIKVRCDFSEGIRD